MTDNFGQKNVVDPQKPSNWLLLGICGSGVRAFAELLAGAGEKVIGTDIDSSALSTLMSTRKLPFDVASWENSQKLDSISPNKIVHSVAISEDCPLLIKAKELGIPILPLPVALGSYLQPKRQLCVAGTHGKTTTSGMIWWILNQAGLSPTGFVGGEFCGLQRSGAFGQGSAAVIESCEYRHSFLQLRPHSIVLTGVEPDHFDFFAADSAANQAYQSFVTRLPTDGVLFVNAADARSMAIARHTPAEVVTFGRNGGTTWTGRQLSAEKNEFGQHIEMLKDGRSIAKLFLKVPGLHNLENAIAAFAMAFSEGLDPKDIAGHLESFPGMIRRFEHRGSWRGVELIDDYAHHPSAIQAVLKTARTVYPGRRLIAIFEPHQISRTENLFSDFRQALSGFDESLILPVLPARETASAAQCCRLSGKLVRRISEAGGRSFLLANLDQVPGRLDYSARPGDVVITMGAGRTNQIHDEIHQRLQRDSAA